MAINSMTGYGKGIFEQDGVKVTIELKAVNHRFLDLTIKLPKYFIFAEDIIRVNLKKAFSRGHIDVYLNYEDNRENKNNLTFDYHLVQAYLEAAKMIENEYFCKDNLGTYELLNMPDVVKNTPNEESEEVLREILEKSLAESVEKLNVMRKSEGANIEVDLRKKIENIIELVKKVELEAPKMVEEHRTKVLDRVKEFLKDVPYDETRLLNEVAFYSDKVCIDEEITRLNSHTKHFLEILNKGGVCGKQLDFIVQEMNRETNTIGSKCNNFDVANLVVGLKSEIEKIREQIQNIE